MSQIVQDPQSIPRESPPEPAAAPARSKLEYRPEIDGLRAFAVIPVVLFHMNRLGGFVGGNLGVDVFFVISGFLITSIVKREADSGTFSFSKFWARRIRRIMPAMIAVTVASLLFTFFFVYRPDQPSIYNQSTWSLLSGANIYFWRFVGDYWGMAAETSPFLHMWSLAVEEQFYLFVPPAIWLIYKFAPRHLLACILVVAASSFALFVAAVHRYPEASFYLLPTRAWELAAGCALAVIPARSRGTMQASLGVVGLVMIVASYFLVTSLGIGLLLPVIGTVLVIAYARSGVSYSILANPVTVYAGKLSYSLYLWHWPVIVFPAYLDQRPPIWMTLTLMTVLAIASYYLVETPTRHVKGIVRYVVAALVLTTAGSMALAHFHQNSYNTAGYDTPQLYIRAYDCNPTAPPIGDTWTGMDLMPGELTPQSFTQGGVVTGKGDPQVVVLGDSHATFWAPVVRKITDAKEIPASFWIMSGVSPFFSVPAVRHPTPWYISQDNVFQYDQSRIDALKQWKPRVVVIAVRWAEKNEDEVKAFFDYLGQTAGTVLLIEQPPELTIGNRNALQYLRYKGFEPKAGVQQFYPTTHQEFVDRGRALIRAIAAAHPNCRVIPTADLYENSGKALVLDGGQVTYMDDDHLSYYGASLAAQRIQKAIEAAMESQPNPVR